MKGSIGSLAWVAAVVFLVAGCAARAHRIDNPMTSGFDEELAAAREAFAAGVTTAPRQIDFTQGGRQTFTLRIENPFHEAVTCRLAWYVPSLRWRMSPLKGEVHLAAGGSMERAFTVTRKGGRAAPDAVPVAVIEVQGATAGAFEVRKELPLARAHSVSGPRDEAAIDGYLDEWRGADPIVLDRAGQVVRVGDDAVWEEGIDLSAKVYFGRDREHLRVGARVKDDEHCMRYSGRYVNYGDRLIFALRKPGSDDVHVIALAKTPHGYLIWRRRDVAGAPAGEILGPEIKIEQNDRTLVTIYEVAIPFKDLPGLSADDAVLEASVLVCDDDGEGLENYIRWTPGILPYVDADHFGKLFFE